MASMRIRLHVAAWSAALAASLGLQPAGADIYTWVDASGTVNISNLSPPEGVRVTRITREAPRDTIARDVAVREAVRQAELQALADRVRQLENEAESVQPPAPPPQVVYVPVPAPAPVQYQVEMAPPANDECDPAWSSCWGGWGSGFYPASVIVVRAPNFHRSPPGHSGHRSPPGRPGHSFQPGRPGNNLQPGRPGNSFQPGRPAHSYPSLGLVLGPLGLGGR
jgi:hypothetical protein